MGPVLPALFALPVVACGSAEMPTTTQPRVKDAIATASPLPTPLATPAPAPPAPTADIERRLCVDSLLVQERWLQEFKDSYRDVHQLTDILEIHNAYQNAWRVASYIARTAGNSHERCVCYFKAQSLRFLGDQQLASEAWSALVETCAADGLLTDAGWDCHTPSPLTSPSNRHA